MNNDGQQKHIKKKESILQFTSPQTQQGKRTQGETINISTEMRIPKALCTAEDQVMNVDNIPLQTDGAQSTKDIHMRDSTNESIAETEMALAETEGIDSIQNRRNNMIDHHFNPNEDERHEEKMRQQRYQSRPREYPDEPIVSRPEEYVAYYDIKVKLQASTDAWGELKHSILQVLQELWALDETAKIFVYSTSVQMNDPSCISCPDDLENLNNKELVKFFDRGYPLPGGGNKSVCVLITHDIQFNHMMASIGAILKSRDQGIYRCTLQAEKSTTIGWAYMSTQYTDKESLAEALTKKLKNPIGLQWRVITTDGTPAIKSSKDMIRAMHFVVEDKDVQYAKYKLTELYHHKKIDGFPLGMRFRFMPMFNRLPNLKSKGNFRVMMNYQRLFCKGIGEVTNGDIVDIDGLLPGGQSIRDYLMAMRIDNDPEKPMFAAINPSYKEGFSYNFMPQYREVATITLQHLLTRLRHEHPDQQTSEFGYHRVDRHFAQVAKERANETRWDPENNCAVAIGVDNIEGTIQAMQEVDKFWTFQDDDNGSDTGSQRTSKADDESTTIGYLSYGDGVSTVESNRRRTPRSSSRSRKSGSGSVTSGISRVSFAPSVGSPMTVDPEVNSVATGYSRSEVEELVQNAVDQRMEVSFNRLQTTLISSVNSQMNQCFAQLHHKQQQPNQQQYLATQEAAHLSEVDGRQKK
jgi:hypothetical protein